MKKIKKPLKISEGLIKTWNKTQIISSPSYLSMPAKLH